MMVMSFSESGASGDCLFAARNLDAEWVSRNLDDLREGDTIIWAYEGVVESIGDDDVTVVGVSCNHHLSDFFVDGVSDGVKFFRLEV